MAAALQLYPKKSKLALGAIGSAGVLLLVLFGLWHGPSPEASFFVFREPPIFYITFGLGLLVFGYLCAFALRNLLQPRPWVVLDSDTAAVDGLNYRFVAPWSEFSGFAVLSSRRGHTIVLKLRDPQAFVAQQPAGRAAATARALIGRFGSPFLINLGELEVDRTALARLLDAHLPSETPTEPEPPPAAP